MNIKAVNPIIDFENSPFCLAEKLSNWKLPDTIPRRYAGVSSFGFGGVNAHVILEEYPKTSSPPIMSHALLPFILSAKNELSLQALLKEWREYVKTKDFQSQSLKDI